MGRLKGSKMSEEAKLAMRAKREANRLGKESAFVMIWDNLKFLNYSQLDAIAKEIYRLIDEKKESERLKLIEMKEIIENKIKALSER